MLRAVVCAIIRDEIDLEEWVAYNLAIGFEHLYIYDNQSQVPLTTRLKSFIDAKLVTVVPNWTDTTQDRSRSFQVAAYNNYLKRWGRASADGKFQPALWTAFIDGDEYIALKKHANVIDFVKEFDSFDVIGLNWLMMGSNGHEKTPAKHLIIEAFTKCAVETNQHLKRIVKTSKTVSYCIHNGRFVRGAREVDSLKRPISNGPFNQNTTCGAQNVADVACIHHYFCRSRDHWARRVQRGSADITNNTRNNYSMKDFDNYQAMNARQETFMIDSGFARRTRDVLQKYGYLQEEKA